ncbi:MAG: hypothetical protein SGPRY_000668, partial [Prymnesium sp.]
DPLVPTSKATAPPALSVERWGDVLCKVTIPDDPVSSEWNLTMKNSTVCLYTDDAENCKLLPRRSIQMVDLVDTDEVVVKVSRASYLLRRILGTVLVIGILVGLDELFILLYGAGVLQHVIPAGIYASLAVYTSYWWLLVLIPILPLSYIIVGCFVEPPYADVFKGSKLTVVTGSATTTFRMQDKDLYRIQANSCPHGPALICRILYGICDQL